MTLELTPQQAQATLRALQQRHNTQRALYKRMSKRTPVSPKCKDVAIELTLIELAISAISFEIEKCSLN